uniref:Uncharacterized protein n=1 Tax=Setaria digitata TaxID=48799 RepID=A0A915PPW1_9BILA
MYHFNTHHLFFISPLLINICLEDEERSDRSSRIQNDQLRAVTEINPLTRTRTTQCQPSVPPSEASGDTEGIRPLNPSTTTSPSDSDAKKEAALYVRCI